MPEYGVYPFHKNIFSIAIKMLARFLMTYLIDFNSSIKNILIMFSIDVVIETPKGSAQKYDYDPSTHFFKLKKILPSGMMFPYDFGFIPGTRGEDGDPLDIIVISEFQSFPGCKMKCRVIGGIKAEQ